MREEKRLSHSKMIKKNKTAKKITPDPSTDFLKFSDACGLGFDFK